MAAMNSSSFGVVAIIATFYAIVLPVARATSLAPAPASALTSDGNLSYISIFALVTMTCLCYV